MATNFPNSPSLNDIFTSNDKTWTWDGNVWRAVGTQVGSGGDGGPVDIANYSDWFDDFLYHGGHSSQYFTSPTSLWRTLVVGNNQFTSTTSEARHPGIHQTAIGNGAYTIFCLTNDQNSSSRNSWFISADADLIFEALIRFPILPSDTENYYMRWGLTDVNNATEAVLMYMIREASVNQWACVTTNSSTSTTTYTAVEPTAGAWHKIKFVATPDEVLFYVDSVLLATHTTNIPDQKLTIYITGIRSAGTTYRYIDMDYVRVKQQFIGGR